MIRKLIIAGAVGIVASVGAMVVGENQPGLGLIRLIDPARRPSGFDLYVLDYYFIVDPTTLVLNLGIFGGVAFILMAMRSALPPGKRAGA